MEALMSSDPFSIDRNIVDVVRDSGRIITRNVAGETGATTTGFDAMENTLTAEIWPGDDEPVLDVTGLTATWVDAAAGKYVISIPPISEGVTSEIYWVRVMMVAEVDRTIEIFRTRVRILDAPGGATSALESYCTYRDILDHAPWIESLQTDTDRSGFARQRTAAKNWLDHAISRRAQSSDSSWHDRTRYIYYGVVPPNWQYSKYVAQLLKDGKLMVDETVKRISAYYTIHLICETQLSPQGAYGPYLDMSRRMIGMAQNLLETCVIEFDADGDGVGDISFEMGRISGRTLT